MARRIPRRAERRRRDRAGILLAPVLQLLVPSRRHDRARGLLGDCGGVTAAKATKPACSPAAALAGNRIRPARPKKGLRRRARRRPAAAPATPSARPRTP